MLSPHNPWETEKAVEDPLRMGTSVRAVHSTILVLDSGASWEDPGCTANDAVDGNLTSKVCGLKVSLFHGSRCSQFATL